MYQSRESGFPPTCGACRFCMPNPISTAQGSSLAFVCELKGQDDAKKWAYVTPKEPPPSGCPLRNRTQTTPPLPPSLQVRPVGPGFGVPLQEIHLDFTITPQGVIRPVSLPPQPSTTLPRIPMQKEDEFPNEFPLLEEWMQDYAKRVQDATRARAQEEKEAKREAKREARRKRNENRDRNRE